jgi:hypothetical protein
MVVVPLKTAVGLALTVTTALPEISAGNALHLLSLADVRVYVVVMPGETVNVYGLALTVSTTGVDPSV